MKTIGIRELRQRASEYLRLVQTGETVQVTDRGRPIALIVPIHDEGPLEELITQGRIQPAQGDLLDLGPPVPAAPGVRSASETLRRARDKER